MRKAIFFQLAFLISQCSFSQKNLSEESVLNIYTQQLSRSYHERGMTDYEIDRYLNLGRNSFKTLEEIPQRLHSIFEEEEGEHIGIIFYFFDRDTLHRHFITWDSLYFDRGIPITKAGIEKINVDLYSSMNIYGLALNRSPKLRGFQPKQSPGKKLSREMAIANAQKILIPPAFNDKIKHLIVIPCFSIGSFPFQLLQPYGDNSLLIDKCSFSVAPSLIDLFAVRNRVIKDDQFKSREKNTLSLFVSNPKYPVTTEYQFPNLPGAEKEIKTVMSYVQGEKTLLQGSAATKSAVMEKIRRSELVYFATHGMSSDKDPLKNNFIVLSGKDPFLTSKDIMQMRDTMYTYREKIFPDIVILSACQTGLGKSLEAGITGGLARSFLIAGASQVIMSLWSVDDDATAYMMGRFMDYMQDEKNYSPAEQLRLAQLDTRKKYPNPMQWASFSLFGVTR